MPWVEIIRPYRHFTPGHIAEFDGGVADVLVRRGFGRYVEELETAALKQTRENAMQKVHRTFKGK